MKTLLAIAMLTLGLSQAHASLRECQRSCERQDNFCRDFAGVQSRNLNDQLKEMKGTVSKQEFKEAKKEASDIKRSMRMACDQEARECFGSCRGFSGSISISTGIRL